VAHRFSLLRDVLRLRMQKVLRKMGLERYLRSRSWRPLFSLWGSPCVLQNNQPRHHLVEISGSAFVLLRENLELPDGFGSKIPPIYVLRVNSRFEKRTE